jgi:hypothetical protein
MLKHSWRGRVDESSSSPEGRNNVERGERQDKAREIRDAQTGMTPPSPRAFHLEDCRKHLFLMRSILEHKRKTNNEF